MFKLIKYKYDYIIIILIASLSYGAYELLGALNPLRIIGLIAFPYVIRNFKWYFKDTFIKNWSIFIIFWWTFMSLSLLWTNDMSKGIIYYIHNSLMLICIFLMIRMCALARNPVKDICIGWLIFLGVCLPIAFWEISTGNHLKSGSFNVEGLMADGSIRIFAAVTFGNLNSFVFMLCLSMPFISMQILSSKTNIKFKILCLFALIMTLVVLLVNASRVGIFCITIIISLLCIQSYINSNLLAKVILVLCCVMLAKFLIDNLETIEILSQIETRLSGRSSIMQDDARENLIRGAVDIILELYGFGGGIMSMIGLYSKYTSCDLLYAHNFYLELMIEYGIIIAIIFYLLFYYTIFILRKPKTPQFNLVFWYCLLTSPFLFVLDDYFQPRCGIWIYIGILVSIAYLVKNRKYYESETKM